MACTVAGTVASEVGAIVVVDDGVAVVVDATGGEVGALEGALLDLDDDEDADDDDADEDADVGFAVFDDDDGLLVLVVVVVVSAVGLKDGCVVRVEDDGSDDDSGSDSEAADDDSDADDDDEAEGCIVGANVFSVTMVIHGCERSEMEK